MVYQTTISQTYAYSTNGLLAKNRAVKLCGKSYIKQAPICEEANLGKVDDSFCQIDSKPDVLIEPCNVFECQAEYKFIN